MIETIAFDDFAAKKSREAVSASIERLSTVFDRRDSSRVRGIGNTWSREHYGGEFGLVHPQPTRTAISLVLIQTKDRNTGGPNPGAFGGGATDKHLIYEGLSRVAVNAVLAGLAAFIRMRSSRSGIQNSSRCAHRSVCRVTRRRSSYRSVAV